jgi:hypothetical protein
MTLGPEAVAAQQLCTTFTHHSEALLRRQPEYRSRVPSLGVCATLHTKARPGELPPLLIEN